MATQVQYQLVGNDGAHWMIAEGDRLSLGRSQRSDVRISDSAVSRRHATLIVSHGRCWIRDEDSTHGTFVNGRRVPDQQEFRPGDTLQIGPATFRLEQVPVTEAAERGPIPERRRRQVIWGVVSAVAVAIVIGIALIARGGGDGEELEPEHGHSVVKVTESDGRATFQIGGATVSLYPVSEDDPYTPLSGVEVQMAEQGRHAALYVQPGADSNLLPRFLFVAPEEIAGERRILLSDKPDVARFEGIEFDPQEWPEVGARPVEEAGAYMLDELDADSLVLFVPEGIDESNPEGTTFHFLESPFPQVTYTWIEPRAVSSRGNLLAAPAMRSHAFGATYTAFYMPWWLKAAGEVIPHVLHPNLGHECDPGDPECVRQIMRDFNNFWNQLWIWNWETDEHGRVQRRTQKPVYLAPGPPAKPKELTAEVQPVETVPLTATPEGPSPTSVPPTPTSEPPPTLSPTPPASVSISLDELALTMKDVERLRPCEQSAQYHLDQEELPGEGLESWADAGLLPSDAVEAGYSWSLSEWYLGTRQNHGTLIGGYAFRFKDAASAAHWMEWWREDRVMPVLFGYSGQVGRDDLTGFDFGDECLAYVYSGDPEGMPDSVNWDTYVLVFRRADIVVWLFTWTEDQRECGLRPGRELLETLGRITNARFP